MILVNGLPSEHVRVFDRGLTYGDGVFSDLAGESGPSIVLATPLRQVVRGLCGARHSVSA